MKVLEELWQAREWIGDDTMPVVGPSLPGKTLAEGNGVRVEQYYRSGDHAPAHAHVKGGGPATRIGPNGKPLPNNPKMTPAQQEVYDANKSTIRRAINKIGRWLDFNGE